MSAVTRNRGLSVNYNMPVIFSFDVEEHYRIEAAAGVVIPSELKAHCLKRLVPPTRWILDELAKCQARATFFIVGQASVHNPELIRSIHREGHEVASHGWDHRRVSDMDTRQFHDDARKTKDALEQVIGAPVVGYRAPTFSIGRGNPWAIDVLADLGFAYDSSVYPVRHDRYGVPAAPREPFLVAGLEREILELPPATWRVLGNNLPMGGGGYFRLFPLWCTRRAINQVARLEPSVATLYFHPWEFDTEQRKLPLSRSNRFRTYVGRARTRSRLSRLLRHSSPCRAIDIVQTINSSPCHLRRFALTDDSNGLPVPPTGVAGCIQSVNVG